MSKLSTLAISSLPPLPSFLERHRLQALTIGFSRDSTASLAPKTMRENCQLFRLGAALVGHSLPDVLASRMPILETLCR
jgi:hypothetical protein